MRNIFVISATQVVTSEQHPEGIFSNVQGYPKNVDSMSYDGKEDVALIVAKADFADRVKQLTIAGNRAMWTVTLEMANGRQIERQSFGSFPEASPKPEPEPEPEAE